MSDYERFAEGFTARTEHGPTMRTGRFAVRWSLALVALAIVIAIVWRWS